MRTANRRLCRGAGQAANRPAHARAPTRPRSGAQRLTEAPALRSAALPAGPLARCARAPAPPTQNIQPARRARRRAAPRGQDQARHGSMRCAALAAGAAALRAPGRGEMEEHPPEAKTASRRLLLLASTALWHSSCLPFGAMMVMSLAISLQRLWARVEQVGRSGERNASTPRGRLRCWGSLRTRNAGADAVRGAVDARRRTAADCGTAVCTAEARQDGQGKEEDAREAQARAPGAPLGPCAPAIARRRLLRPLPCSEVRLSSSRRAHCCPRVDGVTRARRGAPAPGRSAAGGGSARSCRCCSSR